MEVICYGSVHENIPALSGFRVCCYLLCNLTGSSI